MAQLIVTFLFIGMMILSACGQTGPASETGSDDAPTPPTKEAAPPENVESLPVSPTAAPTGTSSPENSPVSTIPTPTPEEIAAAQGNPDLDYAQVIFVRATQNDNGLWKFDTTVRHNDQGWDDYADAWQVVDPNTGRVLAERILAHPHDNEQPFTRSQNNIEIPPEITRVIVRAKDNVEGFGGQEVLVDLTVSEGQNFEVIRP